MNKHPPPPINVLATGLIIAVTANVIVDVLSRSRPFQQQLVASFTTDFWPRAEFFKRKIGFERKINILEVTGNKCFLEQNLNFSVLNQT